MTLVLRYKGILIDTYVWVEVNICSWREFLEISFHCRCDSISNSSHSNNFFLGLTIGVDNLATLCSQFLRLVVKFTSHGVLKKGHRKK